MATARDLVEASLREIGVLAGGEAAASADASDGLSALNRLIDSWSNERLTLYTTTRTTWTITANTQSYLVGTSQVVNVSRPTHVDEVRFVDTSLDPDTEFPISELTVEAYASWSQKASTATYPTNYYYNPTYASATISLFPIPTSTTLTGVLYAPAVLGTLASLSTSVSFPPGYERFLIKNLAIELLPSYERQPNPMLVEQARESKTNIKRMNERFRLRDLAFPMDALISANAGYDINQG